MSQQWYYAKDGQRQGPIASDTLKEMAISGQLQPSDHVWREGMSNWVPAGKLKGLFPDVALKKPPPLPAAIASAAESGRRSADVAPSVAQDVATQPAAQPISVKSPELIQSHSDSWGMEDGGDLGIGAVVKSTVKEFKSLDYGFLVPFKKIFSTQLLRKKAARWVFAFGLFPLILVYMKNTFEWTFEGSSWWIGGYFCLFWATYFHGILHPDASVWKRSVKWAIFTIVIGLPVLFFAQNLPIIKTFYSGTESKSVLYRLLGFVLGVGIVEETCKALPFLVFALRKKERMPLKSGIFLGMMSGFGFALAEVVQYSVRYWTESASASVLAIATAVDKSTDYYGHIHASVFGEQMKEVLPKLVELSGNLVLVQIVRFMTLPLLHACWAGVVGWFIATASRRSGNPWPIVTIGILFVAALHGTYDVFSDGIFGILLAGISLLVFMGYLAHGQDDEKASVKSGLKAVNSTASVAT